MKDHDIHEAYAYGMELEICSVGKTGKKGTILMGHTLMGCAMDLSPAREETDEQMLAGLLLLLHLHE